MPVEVLVLCLFTRLSQVMWTGSSWACVTSGVIPEGAQPLCPPQKQNLDTCSRPLPNLLGILTSLKNQTWPKWPWCWERLRAGGEGDDRGWDGWMASLTQWTWVWVDSRSWSWTGRPGMLRFMGSQRVRHNWATELNCTDLNRIGLT